MFLPREARKIRPQATRPSFCVLEPPKLLAFRREAESRHAAPPFFRSGLRHPSPLPSRQGKQGTMADAAAGVEQRALVAEFVQFIISLPKAAGAVGSNGKNGEGARLGEGGRWVKLHDAKVRFLSLKKLPVTRLPKAEDMQADLLAAPTVCYTPRLLKEVDPKNQTRHVVVGVSREVRAPRLTLAASLPHLPRLVRLPRLPRLPCLPRLPPLASACLACLSCRSCLSCL